MSQSKPVIDWAGDLMREEVIQKAKSKCIFCVKYVRMYERGYPSIFLSTLPRQIPGYIIIKTTLSWMRNEIETQTNTTLFCLYGLSLVLKSDLLQSP